jgi:hypothetical protein
MGRMLSRRLFLQTAAAGVGLADPSRQQRDVATASASRDETPRVAIVLSSFAGSSDHDGTRIEGLRDPQPVTRDLSDAQAAAMVRKALDLDNGREGGLRGIAGAEDWVVIKPDISACYGLDPETRDGGAHRQYIPGAATDLRVVRGIIAYLVEHRCGARITIAEGSGEWLPKERSKSGVDGWTTDWGGAFGGLSYRQMMADFAKQHDSVQFDVIDLNFDEAVPSQAPANPSHTYYVPATIQRCDRLISVAPLRTHRKAAVSLSILNYLGTAPGAFYGFPKSKLDEIGPVDEVAVDLFSFHPADYAVVGGSWGIEGDGPSHPGGRSVHHNVVVAGARAVAVDAVSAEIMGFDPSEIRHLRIAERKGFGGWDTSAVWTRGNDIESARRPFLKPSA